MTSIRDVAKKAGVGVSTVSRALNETGYVAAETKARILAIAKELDYSPNELARHLFRNRTGIIGIVVPDMENPFFSKLLKCLEIQLHNNGYKAMICNSVGISTREQDLINMLRQNAIDGIITGAHSLCNDAYLNLNKPVVAIDRDLGDEIPLIHSDHKAGGRLAAEILVSAGCKRVLNFAGSFCVQTPSNDRHYGFIEVMKANKIPVETVEMAWNILEYDYYRKVMTRCFDTYGNIDGIFTTDVAGLCALGIAIQRGICVPRDLHIIGYDAVELTRLFTPVLTSIAQDIPVLANTAVNTMMDLLSGKKVPMKQVIPISLQEGGTV